MTEATEYWVFQTGHHVDSFCCFVSWVCKLSPISEDAQAVTGLQRGCLDLLLSYSSERKPGIPEPGQESTNRKEPQNLARKLPIGRSLRNVLRNTAKVSLDSVLIQIMPLTPTQPMWPDPYQTQGTFMTTPFT